MSEFPKIHNFDKAIIEGDNITFTYVTSLSKVVTETKPILEPDDIIELIDERIYRFGEAPVGARESEMSRAERKYISAHPEKVLREAFDSMNDDQKMELDMMLSEKSHTGISNPKWVKYNVFERNDIVGDDKKKL